MHGQQDIKKKINGQLYTPDALLLGKESPLPIELESEWTIDLVCTRVVSSYPCQELNCDCSGVQPVA